MKNLNNIKNNQTELIQLLDKNHILELVDFLTSILIHNDVEEIEVGGDSDYLIQVLMGGNYFKGYSEYEPLELIQEFSDREYIHKFYFGEELDTRLLLQKFLQKLNPIGNFEI